MIPKVTNLTEEQIKEAAVNLVRETFKEMNKPKKICVSELSVLLIYRDPKDGIMEPYYLDEGEFVFNRTKDGKIAEVEIYPLWILKDYL